VFVGLTTLLITTITVSAVTGIDEIDDVYDGLSQTVVSKPNIDITEMSYELNGNLATLTMTVKGNITDSEYFEYSITLSNDINSSTGYTMYYTNGTGWVLKDWSSQVNSEIRVSEGNTLIVKFILSEDEITDFNLFMGFNTGYAEETKDLQWVDSAPNDYVTKWYGGDENEDIPTDNSNEDDNIPAGDTEDKEGGIPGFELILVICAIVLFLFLKQKR
jgi:hypothetical protein